MPLLTVKLFKLAVFCHTSFNTMWHCIMRVWRKPVTWHCITWWWRKHATWHCIAWFGQEHVTWHFVKWFWLEHGHIPWNRVTCSCQNITGLSVSVNYQPASLFSGLVWPSGSCILFNNFQSTENIWQCFQSWYGFFLIVCSTSHIFAILYLACLCPWMSEAPQHCL